MISTENKALNFSTNDDDFTIEHYKELLDLSLKNYQVVDYKNIPWGKRFLIWRHDLDYSINRALELAKIEAKKRMKATYFINPHSEFYNIAEASQYKKIKEILSLGHDLGLHFDAAFYEISSEEHLEQVIKIETDYIYSLLGTKPVAFSFHNPIAKNFSCDKDHYGGLVNCYSKRFKEEVSYCSDSNGYWRFQRLFDVLLENNDPCLQVLTHPGWWVRKPAPPRQRIFRSIYGRASNVLQIYDDTLNNNQRINHAGAMDALASIKKLQPKSYELFDYLWNKGHHKVLFTQLWLLHESQIYNICKAEIIKEWHVDLKEVNSFFKEDGLKIISSKLFNATFEISLSDLEGIDNNQYALLVKIYHDIIYNQFSSTGLEIEHYCVELCQTIQHLASWGKKQDATYDGIANLNSIDLLNHGKKDHGSHKPNEKDVSNKKEGKIKKWEIFKSNLL